MPPRLPSSVPVALAALPKPQVLPTGFTAPLVHAAAPFSTTASRPGLAKSRRYFLKWLRGSGKVHKNIHEEGAFYLRPAKEHQTGPETSEWQKNHPFPLNPLYTSPRVLTDEAREIVWEEVMKSGKSLKVVSAEYGIDVQRVAAIVRLKEVQRQWEAQVRILKTLSCPPPFPEITSFCHTSTSKWLCSWVDMRALI